MGSDLLGHSVMDRYILKRNFHAMENENGIFQREVTM